MIEFHQSSGKTSSLAAASLVYALKCEHSLQRVSLREGVDWTPETLKEILLIPVPNLVLVSDYFAKMPYFGALGCHFWHCSANLRHVEFEGWGIEFDKLEGLEQVSLITLRDCVVSNLLKQPRGRTVVLYECFDSDTPNLGAINKTLHF